MVPTTDPAGGVDVTALVAAVERRTAEVVTALEALGPEDLDAPTLLDGWTVLTVACHLRHGAESTLRMLLAALHDEPTSRYPAGRPRQRPATLEPRADEDPAAVVRSVAATSAALQQVLADLRPADWDRRVRPAKVEDPDDLTVRGLLVLRSTEVEVHGTDLDLGLSPWSEPFVDAALRFRLTRLDGRWPAHDLTGSWLLLARDGPTWLVNARVGAAAAREVDGALPPVDARIEGEPRDVLALLLGRQSWDRLEVGGDVDVAHRFATAFPGP